MSDPMHAHLTIPGNHCVVHGYHRPKPLRTVKHHIWPQEYGGPSTGENLVQVCDNGHYNIHAILTALIRSQPVPKGTRTETQLARLGFERIQDALNANAIQGQHLQALTDHIKETR